MPNFEQKVPKTTEVVQPQQQETDLRYDLPIDAYYLSDIAEHYQNYFDWKEKTTGDIYAADKSWQMSEIYSILQSYANHAPQESTGADMIKSLNNLLESKKQGIQTANKERKKKLQEEVDNIRATITFVSAKIVQPITPDQLEKMNQSLAQEQAKVLAPMVGENQNIEAPEFSDASQPETSPTIIAPPVSENQGGNTEQEQREQLLIDQVLVKSGANINTSFGSKESPDHRGGFIDRSDGKNKQQQGWMGFPSIFGYSETGRGNEGNVLTPHNVTEIVYMVPQLEDVVEQKTRYVEEKKGGIMGLGAKTVQRPVIENVIVGHKPAGADKFITGGDQEPAVKIYYETLTNNNDSRLHSTYKDYSNSRGGNLLGMELVLPESLAKQVIIETQRNPDFFHQLIDRIAVQNIGIDQASWFDGEGNGGVPLRPPYEKIHQAVGGERKMYILEQSQIQDKIDQGLAAEFDPHFVSEY